MLHERIVTENSSCPSRATSCRRSLHVLSPHARRRKRTENAAVTPEAAVPQSNTDVTKEGDEGADMRPGGRRATPAMEANVTDTSLGNAEACPAHETTPTTTTTTTNDTALAANGTHAVPKPTSLAHLCQLLHAEMPAGKGVGDLCPKALARISAILSAYDPTTPGDPTKGMPFDWSPYALYEPGKPYSRNLVDDGNGLFNLMILIWAPDRESPIHDHAGSHCLMKVLQGNLREDRFEWPDQQCPTSASAMEPTGHTGISLGQVAYIHDQIGLHKIANPDAHTFSASLHLYSPPFSTCHTFDPATAKKRASGQCLFYSHAGRTLGHDAAVQLCGRLMAMKAQEERACASCQAGATSDATIEKEAPNRA